jgi:hypothetical protein
MHSREDFVDRLGALYDTGCQKLAGKRKSEPAEEEGK